MQNAKKILAVMAAATMLTACGSQPAASNAPASSEQSAISSGSLPEPEKQDKPETWHATADGISFDVDFREFPTTSSGPGYIENKDNVALAVGALGASAEFMYNFDPLAVDDITQLPDYIKGAMLDSFGRAKYDGYNTSGEVDRNIVIGNTEVVETKNGYEACRFEGNYKYKGYTDDKDYSFGIVGYVVKLNQSGYPVYIIAADMSDTQENINDIDAVAFACVNSLKETA